VETELPCAAATAVAVAAAAVVAAPVVNGYGGDFAVVDVAAEVVDATDCAACVVVDETTVVVEVEEKA